MKHLHERDVPPHLRYQERMEPTHEEIMTKLVSIEEMLRRIERN